MYRLASLLTFLPAFIAIYYLVMASERVVRLPAPVQIAPVLVLLAGSLWLLSGSPVALLVFASVAATLVLAVVIERTRASNPGVSRAALAVSIAASVAFLAVARSWIPGITFAFAGVTVIACQEIALVVDLFRGRAGIAHPVIAAAHLLQFPVLPTGPLIGYQDSIRQWGKLDRAIGLGAFAYGMRRIAIGLIKLILIAGTLATPVDAIFALPAANVSTDAAWLAAVCLALQYYFRLSGCADIAVGLGRVLGLRYPENFRRPYLACSVREFWRRWHVTSIAWLRDYLAFPMVGRDAPTLRLAPNIVLGFVLLGLWYGGGWTVVGWAAYSSAFLALEAVGLEAALARRPRFIQRVYVLLVVAVGWTILRADSLASAAALLEAMAGLGGVARLTSVAYLTPQVSVALLVGLLGAGPLIPWLSRWRVSIDALTASLAMMLASVWLLLWRVRLFLRARPRP